jgi:DUF438 domain-containing protein
MRSAAHSRIPFMLVASTTLAEHHRRCDALFAAARAAATANDWTLLVERMGALREAVLAHFRYEEERVFPLYEETSGEEGATEHLSAQHDDMRAALWFLATQSPEREAQRYCAELEALQTAFDAHAAEEESRMYPVFERVLKR